jgi:hypothetical protein
MKLKDMQYDQQCLLIGRVARMINSGMSMSEIAEDLNKPLELIIEASKVIYDAFNKED